MGVGRSLGATPQGPALELRRPLLGSQAAASSRTGLLGLIGLLFTGLLISVSAGGTDALLPESVRPLPAWLAGPLGSSGLGLGVPELIVVLALMYASYVMAVRGAATLSPRIVLTAIAAIYALVLIAPPLLSTDIFSYGVYGRMGALYSANPYLNGPHAIALDPLFPFVGAKWSYTPTAYGPLFTALSSVLAPLDIAASALAYKAIAVVASLAMVVIVWKAAALRGLDPVKAAILVALNPLVVVYGIGGGHNDLLMVAGMVAGAYLLLQQRERAAGGMIVAAAGIKLTAGLLLPFALAGSPGRRRNLMAGAGIAAALTAALGFALFGTGPLHLLGTLEKVQASGDWHSIPGFIGTRLGLGKVGHIAGLVLAITFVIVSAWLLRKVWRGELDWIDGAAWAAGALIVTASSLLPWYIAWLLPLAALGSDRRLFVTAVALTGVVQGIQMIGYVPHGSVPL